MSHKKGNHQIHPHLLSSGNKPYGRITLGGKMKACQDFLKSFAVFYTTVLPYVPMQITKWTTAQARGKIQTLKKADGWADKAEEHFTWSYRPSLGASWEQALVEHEVLPQPAYTPRSLSASPSSTLAEHPAQHCIPLKQLFSNLQWAWGLAKALWYKSAA